MRRFTPALALALIGALAVPARAGADTMVRMLDSGGLRFSPEAATIPMGTRVTWRNDGDLLHNSNRILPYPSSWSSRDLGSGETYAKRFLFAGVFPYRCSLHSSDDGSEGMAGTLRVPLRVTPSRGTSATTFTIRVADAAIPDGWAFEVQRRVGGGDWMPFRNRLESATTTFRSAVEGTHAFRARLERISPAASNRFSPAKSITIS